MRLTASTLLAVLTFAVGLWAQNTMSSGSSVTIATVSGEPLTQADLDRVQMAHADNRSLRKRRQASHPPRVERRSSFIMSGGTTEFCGLRDVSQAYDPAELEDQIRNSS
jgi:hypothetical protein